MTMQFSNPLQIMELKAEGDDWTVEGYISTFGSVDLGGDVVMPGAFKETLKTGPKVRFLKSHDPDQILGIPKKLHEDKKGLFGQFKISKTKLGEDTRQLLMDGAMDSFSMGYNAVDYKIVDDDIRELHEVRLWEASIVSMPMNPEATVTRVKSLVDKTISVQQQLDILLMEVSGLANDHPLSETKRKELEELMERFSRFDAVRSKFQSVLTPQTSQGSLTTLRKLASARKRLEHVLGET